MRPTRLRREAPLSNVARLDQRLRRCLSISRTVSGYPSVLRQLVCQPAGVLRCATCYIISILYLTCQVQFIANSGDTILNFGDSHFSFDAPAPLTQVSTYVVFAQGPFQAEL